MKSFCSAAVNEGIRVKKVPEVLVNKGFQGVNSVPLVGIEPTRCVSTEGF